MILSDQDIVQAVQGRGLVIKPFDRRSVQPSSYDVHLADKLLIFDNHFHGEVDIRKKITASHLLKIDEQRGFVIHPHEFILGSTVETFRIPADLAAKLEGKSSLGRLGLIIHATAGYVDPGFEGQLTFEMSNISRVPIRIYPRIKVAQICFFHMSSPAQILYGDKRLGSKYGGQKGPTASRIYLDFQDDSKRRVKR